MIAAIYCVLTVCLPFMTFGQVQCRIAEALTVLPVFMPAAVPGLFVGCVLSTGAAALITRKWRHVRLRGLPVLSTLPPVVLNALVVGLELTVALYGWDARLYAINALAVGAGELISATGGGLILYIALRGRLNGEKR